MVLNICSGRKLHAPQAANRSHAGDSHRVHSASRVARRGHGRDMYVVLRLTVISKFSLGKGSPDAALPSLPLPLPIAPICTRHENIGEGCKFAEAGSK